MLTFVTKTILVTSTADADVCHVNDIGDHRDSTDVCHENDIGDHRDGTDVCHENDIGDHRDGADVRREDDIGDLYTMLTIVTKTILVTNRRC